MQKDSLTHLTCISVKTKLNLRLESGLYTKSYVPIKPTLQSIINPTFSQVKGKPKFIVSTVMLILHLISYLHIYDNNETFIIYHWYGGPGAGGVKVYFKCLSLV